MKTTPIISIKYHPDSAQVFEAVGDLPLSVWLDSGHPDSSQGRYDIISAQPIIHLRTEKGITAHVSMGTVSHSHENPFDLVKAHMESVVAPFSPKDFNQSLPFVGGAIGYFAYDLGQYTEKLHTLAQQELSLPEMSVGIYDWAIIQDHLKGQSWFVCLPCCPEKTRQDILKRLSSIPSQPSSSADRHKFSVTGLHSDVDADSYRRRIEQIHRYIQAGDCYQVNIAQHFSGQWQGCTYSAYRLLRKALPSPFSAYLSLDRGAILSLSPERFIKVNGREVETKPIKGTRPRGLSPVFDQMNAWLLQTSEKDRAENLMIVDLMRNDISKSCIPGSVKVSKLFALESFPNVHHLVSTIGGTLKDNQQPVDLLKNCFPGGSITGAPKRRAMEIIEELENSRRSIYCGSIGYLSANGQMDTNIAIRTLACDGDRIHCWGGGGIVADSDADQEYAESLTKIQVLLDKLTNIG